MMIGGNIFIGTPGRILDIKNRCVLVREIRRMIDKDKFDLRMIGRNQMNAAHYVDDSHGQINQS